MDARAQPSHRQRNFRAGFGVLTVVMPVAIIASLLNLHFSAEASPVTTVKNKDGSSRTVLWAKYPGVAGLDPQLALNAPNAAVTEMHGQEMLREIKKGVSAEFGYRWHDDDATEPRISHVASNSYGGKSMLTTLRSSSCHSEGVPQLWSGKKRILAIVTGASQKYGFGTPQIDWNVARAGVARRSHDFGGATPQTAVLVGATSMGASGQWLSVDFTDLSQDTYGRFARKTGDVGFHADSVAIQFGATALLKELDRVKFKNALKPFAGLVLPAGLND